MQIEGRNAVREALNSDKTLNKILVDKNYATRHDEILALANKKKVKIEFLPKTVLDKKSKTGHHQGYIGEQVDFVYCSLADILQRASDLGQKPFVVLLDGLEDPHNFGAIIRSCECAGVHGIVIQKNRSVQVNETVVRTSAGAIENMLICRVTNLKEAIDQLKEAGVWVYLAETGGKSFYSENLAKNPVALVIGSEGKGARTSLRTYCDEVLSLPLKGKVNSLNASVACGIAVFEVLRQREAQ